MGFAPCVCAGKPIVILLKPIPFFSDCIFEGSCELVSSATRLPYCALSLLLINVAVLFSVSLWILTVYRSEIERVLKCFHVEFATFLFLFASPLCFFETHSWSDDCSVPLLRQLAGKVHVVLHKCNLDM